MATAILLWSSSSSKESGDEDHEKKPSVEAQEPMPEAAKPRSKRGPKAQAALPKKQPQRGLGVAQLERLRMQERWSKFSETNRSPAPAPVPDQAQNLPFPFAFPTIDPETGLSMARFAPPSYYDAFAESQIRSQQLLQRYRIANGGFPSAAAGVRLFPDPTQVDRCLIPAQDARFQTKSGFPYAGGSSVEAMMVARELSSIQKTQCLSDQCEVCAKKKRFQGENLGFQEFSSSASGGFLDVATNGGDFLELNIGSGRTVDGGSRGFGGRGEWRGGSSAMHADEGLEDVNVAVPRKGKSVGECYYKEYDFFPTKDCCNSRGGSRSAAAGGATEGSVGEAAAASNFLDLSLKLSF